VYVLVTVSKMLFTQETLVLLSVFIITSLLTRTESQATTESGQNAMPNSIVFHSNIASSATEIDEDDQRAFFFNYTFTPPSTSTPAGGYKLLVCAWMEDSDIASVNFRSRPFNLDENPSDEFNMTVTGGFIGRTYLHIVYRLTAAASPGSYNLTFSCPQQVVNPVTFANNQLNLTDVFLQNGQTTEAIFGSSHEFVALRVERLIDKAFMVVVIILVFIVNLGLGCKTDMDKIKSTLRRPIAPIVGVCSQFILMPLVSDTYVRVSVCFSVCVFISKSIQNMVYNVIVNLVRSFVCSPLGSFPFIFLETLGKFESNLAYGWVTTDGQCVPSL